MLVLKYISINFYHVLSQMSVGNRGERRPEIKLYFYQRFNDSYFMQILTWVYSFVISELSGFEPDALENLIFFFFNTWNNASV